MKARSNPTPKKLEEKPPQASPLAAGTDSSWEELGLAVLSLFPVPGGSPKPEPLYYIDVYNDASRKAKGIAAILGEVEHLESAYEDAMGDVADALQFQIEVAHLMANVLYELASKSTRTDARPARSV